MNSAAFIDDARLAARELEAREARRGLTLTEARKRVASSVGCSPGILENLHRGRLKRLEAFVYDRLTSMLIRAREREIQALTHELETLRNRGLRSDDCELQEIETDLATLRRGAFQEAMAARAGR